MLRSVGRNIRNPNRFSILRGLFFMQHSQTLYTKTAAKQYYHGLYVDTSCMLAKQSQVVKLLSNVRKPKALTVIVPNMLADKAAINTGKSRSSNLKNVFTCSTCSAVNGPSYLDFLMSSLEGISSSQYVRALQFRGALYLATSLRTL